MPRLGSDSSWICPVWDPNNCVSRPRSSRTTRGKRYDTRVFRSRTFFDPEVDAAEEDVFPTFIAFENNDPGSFTMTPIPEPSTLLLSVAGLVGLLITARRRRR